MTVNIQTHALSSTDIRRDAKFNREQTLCHIVRKSKDLQMPPSGEAYDIIWRSYVSVKFAKI